MLYSKVIFDYINHLKNLYGHFWQTPQGYYEYYLKLDGYYYCKSKKCILGVLRIRNKRTTDIVPLYEIINDKDYLKELQNHIMMFFNALPRHLLALLAAILVGHLVNNFLLSKLKSKLRGKYLPLRFISATAVGEAALQIIGTTITWFGNLHFTTGILPFVLFSYFYKVAF